MARARTKKPLADPITTEVIRNFVVSCAEDMNAALYRSAFSSIIYEGRDSAVALLDKNGDMLGQSTGVPIFIGNIDVCVKYAIERYGDDLSPGDVIAMNDPYLQGTHGHDVTIIGPIFHKKRLVGYAASRAHWQDIGAIDAGTTMGSTSIFHEGIRLGPTRIVQAYKPIREWFDLLRLNNRMKDIMIGDLNAQIAAIRTGERRLNQMLDRVGVDVFESAKENIYRQSEKLDREAIAAIPDGTYSAEGHLDNDGVTDEPIPVKVARHHQGRPHDHRSCRLFWPGEGRAELRRRADRVDDPPRLQGDDQPDACDHRRFLPDAGSEDPGRMHFQRKGAVGLRVVFYRARAAGRPDDHVARQGDAREGGRRELRRLDGRRLRRRGPAQAMDRDRADGWRLGRLAGLGRRERHDQSLQRFLPQHPGRSLRSEASDEGRGVFHPPRQRRAGALARRLRRRPLIPRAGRLRCVALVRAVEDAGLGRLRRQAWQTTLDIDRRAAGPHEPAETEGQDDPRRNARPHDDGRGRWLQRPDAAPARAKSAPT